MIETSRKNNINFKIQNTQKSNQGVYTCKAYTLNSPSLSFKTKSIRVNIGKLFLSIKIVGSKNNF